MSHKQHAGTWLAFAAGMYAEAMQHACKYQDEQFEPDDAPVMFRVACGEALDALEVDHEEAMKSFAAGRKMLAELREIGLKRAGLPIGEDCQPLLYTGPERQLTGKPDGRLS